MTIGTEHEYSINDPGFRPLPVSDQILKSICGRFESEIVFGDVKLGKELQKTVLEIIPRSPSGDLLPLETRIHRGVRKFYDIFHDRYVLLGLGMHPTLRLDETAVWDHDEGEYYEIYDRLFNIRQHGWLNIQALQVNLSYRNEKDLVGTYNRIRSLLPYLIAVTASSPMVEGHLTGTCDNRLLYYRDNQKMIPQICNNILPEKIRSTADYNARMDEVYAILRGHGAEILCEEWVNSSGLIIRFSRRCLEIKALDEQECVHSDMAVCAFVRSLLRNRSFSPETDHGALTSLMEQVIRQGTEGIRPELRKLYSAAWQSATDDERRYLPVIENRIEHGCLAELITRELSHNREINPVLAGLASCLRENRSWTP
ncbi:glutamate-cysteine ligase family protein [uncultured Methanoregula sp.]|uniref:glutamate-cysteine ligase family protein n=1 Tax=uncultured Methanoregula sp. TaxID=1005933 RepID=UPI002AABA53F|nr:glutamate-cysteine ligase family protein [uncultured Methanoregula sp.]